MLSISYLLSLLLTWSHAGETPAKAAFAPHHDFSGLYRLDQPQAITRREGDSLRVYVRFPNGMVAAKQAFFVAAWSSYDAKRPLWQDSVRHVARLLRRQNAAAWLQVCLPVARLQPGQILSIQPTATATEDARNEAWLEITPNRLARSYILTDSVGNPLLRRYVRTGEGFGLSQYGLQQPFWVKQYAMQFAAALPPMTNPATLAPAPRTLTIRDTLRFRAGQLVRLLKPGIYSLQAGRNEPAIGLLVEENQYPALTTAPELIEPLLYLTTSAERQKLYAASDPKRATDLFWLTIANEQQAAARQLIRTYYGRVAAANELFAAHKAGWMTDRGMLYVVLGPPDAVYRSGQEERWVYRAPAIASGTYVFRAKPSTFAPDNYELVRRPEYEMLWYAAVEQWRKGMTARPGR